MKHLALVLLCLLHSPVFADEATELATLAVERYDAISSGSVIYTFRTKEKEYSKHESIFSGDNWIERASGGACRLNFLEYSLEFSLNYNGPPIASAVISAPQTWERIPYVNKAPVYAGSFWGGHDARWTRDHLNGFTLTGSEMIHGVPTKIIEARESLAKDHRLRLYVARSLNGALPRIEVLDDAGKLTQRCEAKDFRETAKGIFVPSEMSREAKPMAAAVFDPTTNNVISIDVDFSKVNEEFPSSTFQVELPAETSVTDMHKKGQRTEFRTIAPLNSDYVVQHEVELADKWKLEAAKRKTAREAERRAKRRSESE